MPGRVKSHRNDASQRAADQRQSCRSLVSHLIFRSKGERTV
jgi:hypothetical protein